MSAKLLRSISDDNADLQKQIGCMNGLFQLFDRHHFLSGKRIVSQHHKRLPAGQSASNETESKSVSQKTMERSQKKNIKEKHQASTESSRSSFSSSSCSSSFSSADCNKVPQSGKPLSRTVFLESARQDTSIYQSNASSQFCQQSHDLRAVVKDSIHREARGLAIKTASKRETGQKTLKYIDSPRPFQSPKSASARVTVVNESSRVLGKVKEAQRTLNERRDGFLTYAARDAPRYSYDERVSQDALKTRLKELPRLSLDSKERSMRRTANGTRQNHLLADLQRNANSSDILNQQQEPGSYRGPSSVIARLMGLEALPDPMSTNGNPGRQIKTYADDKNDPLAQSLRTDESNQNRVSNSPRNNIRESTSPCPRNADSVKKAITSKCQIEPAPWRQPDGSRSQTSPLKCPDTPTKQPSSPLTVYGEIEKRLAQLEFKKSGKDLRALKQILEAMQKTKQIMECRKDDQTSDSASQISNENYFDRSSKLANSRDLQNSGTMSATTKGTSPPRSFRSPAVIMKPTKPVKKANSSTVSALSRLQTSESANTRKENAEKRTAKELTLRSGHFRDLPVRLNPMDRNASKTVRFSQTMRVSSTDAQVKPKLSTSQVATSLAMRAKLGQEEKQSGYTVPTSEQSRVKRHPSMQQTESSLPYEKPRLNSTSWQQSDFSNEITDLSHQGDTSSMQSESNTSLTSNVDNEVTSGKTQSTYYQKFDKRRNHPETKFEEDGPVVELPKAVMEQPSPISVLDPMFYEDESPSPVKKISNAFQDDADLNHEAEWDMTDPYLLPNSRQQAPPIDHFVQKLMHVSTTHDEYTVNENAQNYNSSKREHKYISEILLASGLLKETESSFMTCQLHPSGSAINPDLFLALEETKRSTRLDGKYADIKMSRSEYLRKVHRKLIFEAVNEILVCKMQCVTTSLLMDKRPRGSQLLRDLCSEIDCLQANNSNHSLDDKDENLRSILWGDLTNQSKNWKDSHSELPWVVLDIERLIFKDLISEVISGEVATLRGKPGGHCRQLFPK